MILKSRIILFFFLPLIFTDKLKLDNIFPDRGPISGNTRVLIYGNYSHLDKKKYNSITVKRKLLK